MVVIDIYGTVIIANAVFSSIMFTSFESVEQVKLVDLKHNQLKKSELNKIIAQSLKREDSFMFELENGKYKIKSQAIKLAENEEPLVLLEFLNP